MPLQSTSGSASYDAFGGGVAAVPKYIEDYFSTFLFTGNASTQTITNGIDLAGKGGLVWTKNRTNAYDNYLYDTARGVNKVLLSNNTIDQQSLANTLTAFNSTGFTLGNSDYGNITNGAAAVSWSWAKAPKFFDVVTYTGDGNNARTIAHNLGSTPGFVIIKKTDSTGNWMCWHNSFASTDYIALNTTGAKNYAGSLTDIFQGVSSTTVTVGSNGVVNSSVNSYVMYVFASNAGGFGLTGTDNVISCGSYSGNNTTPVTVTLGYEPQWILIKRTNLSQDWTLYDNMRGIVTGGADPFLRPNTSDEEVTAQNWISVTATGFQLDAVDQQVNVSGSTYIYIAIRRGPMKVPTSGTSVFSPNAVTMTASGSATITTNFPVDLSFNRKRSTADQYVMDRLRGGSQTSYNYLRTQTTGAETTGSTIGVGFDSNTSLVDNNWLSGVSANTIWWSFQRAPSFFDVVCYTGNYYVGTDFQALTHNLGVVPELAIIKRRSTVKAWNVYYGNVSQYMELQSTAAESSAGDRFDGTSPTATTFYVGADSDTNSGGITYVMYLFATCAGVSKVFSYTGNGSSQTINCGFTAGARWILIKRTDSTGDWYVWDSARGIVSGNDPHLSLNTTAAEVTTDDTIDTDSTGFVVNQVSATNVNVSSATYIGIAIA